MSLPNAKSFVTIRCCYCNADLDSMTYISSKISVFLRNFIIFSTSQSLPSSIYILLWILYFFLLSLHWEHSTWQWTFYIPSWFALFFLFISPICLCGSLFLWLVLQLHICSFVEVPPLLLCLASHPLAD